METRIKEVSTTRTALAVLVVCVIVLSACGDKEVTSLPVAIDNESADPLPDLVFTRYDSHAESSDLFGYRFDDQSITRITLSDSLNEFPVWSKDGIRIAFLTIAGSLNSPEIEARIDEIDLLNGARRTLVRGIAEPVSWSRDSSQIVVTLDRPGGRGLAIVTLSDKSVKQVAIRSEGAAYATWSPVDDLLAYESSRDGDPELFVAQINGEGERQLTNNDVLDEWPQWSTDGSRIAYASGQEGDKDLWVMNADGSGNRQLTDSVVFGDAYPAWSPDDTTIVLTATRNGGSPTLFLVDVASGELTELFEGAAASWRPVKDK